MIIHSDNLEQSKLRKQLSQFVAEEIRILYGLVAKENRKKNLPMSFEQLIKRIDWSRFPGELENVDVEAPYDDEEWYNCLLYTSPSPRDKRQSRMPSSA